MLKEETKLIEPLFIGARARCRKHTTVVLNPDEKECLDCRIEARNLGMRPPFKVKCTEDGWGLKKGETYTVYWVVRDATTRVWEHLSGFVFQTTEGPLLDKIIDADKFIPELYLTEDGKDEWRVGPEQEWEQETPKESEFNEAGLANVG